jgi:hypothetical protein
VVHADYAVNAVLRALQRHVRFLIHAGSRGQESGITPGQGLEASAIRESGRAGPFGPALFLVRSSEGCTCVSRTSDCALSCRRS